MGASFIGQTKHAWQVYEVLQGVESKHPQTLKL